jgi:hypothetical protein
MRTSLRFDRSRVKVDDLTTFSRVKSQLQLFTNPQLG